MSKTKMQNALENAMEKLGPYFGVVDRSAYMDLLIKESGIDFSKIVTDDQGGIDSLSGINNGLLDVTEGGKSMDIILGEISQDMAKLDPHPRAPHQ